MKYWLGGPPVRGDILLPPPDTGNSRSGNEEAYVYVTPIRELAATYTASCGGWLYEVEPIGELEQDPDSFLPEGQSLRCPSARIVRRFRLSRDEYTKRAATIEAFARMLP